MEKVLSAFIISLLLCGVIQAQDKVVIHVFAPNLKDNTALKTNIENNASILLSAFNKAVNTGKKPAYPKEIIVKEADDKLKAMWKNSKMHCTVSELRAVCRVASSGEYQLRGIPMEIFADDVQHKDEKISLHFNLSGQISDISINVVLPTVVAEPEDEQTVSSEVGETEKTQPLIPLPANTPEEDVININMILDFIEKLRTAYNCKDLEYLENIYSDNAIIINVRKKKITQINNSEVIHSINIPKYGYDYQVRTKKAYLDTLKQVFKRNRYINIDFDSIDVDIHPGYNKIYSAHLFQNWNSSTYRDKGFLYLLIDCRKEYEMQIFVRAWAPEKIFNFNSFDKIIPSKKN
jgi:hypothetical protein